MDESTDWYPIGLSFESLHWVIFPDKMFTLSLFQPNRPSLVNAYAWLILFIVLYLLKHELGKRDIFTNSLISMLDTENFCGKHKLTIWIICESILTNWTFV